MRACVHESCIGTCGLNIEFNKKGSLCSSHPKSQSHKVFINTFQPPARANLRPCSGSLEATILKLFHVSSMHALCSQLGVVQLLFRDMGYICDSKLLLSWIKHQLHKKNSLGSRYLNYPKIAYSLF